MRRVFVGLAVATAVAAPAQAEVAWYALQADGAHIGYATHEVAARADGREIVTESVTDLAGAAGFLVRVTDRTTRRENRAGRTVSIVSEARIGRDRTRTSARIEPGAAHVVRQTPRDRRAFTVVLPAGVRFDGGEGLLADWDPAANPKLVFDDFDLETLAVDRVTIEPAPPLPSDPPGGMAALRKRYEGAELRGVVRLSLDAKREVVAVTQPLFSATLTSRLSDRATALAEHPPYATLRGVITKSPYRIAGPLAHGQIRYAFEFRDGLAFLPPTTPEQRVTRVAEGVTLDICEACGPGMSADPDALAAARKPTAWLQSDHPRLRRIAGPIARLHVSDARKMELLVEAARPHITKVEFAGHYSALETLDRRAGDCTEAAVLLAALGRAAGIPTKVANGLVYARAYYHGVSNAFMPHSWTLAYVDGRWRSYDLALDSFDSTHIALTVGDGDARSLTAAGRLAGLLVWNGMTAVRTPGEPEPTRAGQARSARP